jgi:hypothetical protein
MGPVLQREVVIATRRKWFYAGRTVFVAGLFVIFLTSWQLLVGTQRIVNIGDMAWFGAAVFALLAPLQLAVALPFSTLLVAASVSLEKDRKTFDLLLMSRLSNAELVLGKLLAAMLTILVALFAAVPFLLLLSLLGGVSVEQVLRSQLVTAMAAIAAGSLGSLFALWREKTIQALALSTLVLVLWLATWEVVAAGAFGAAPAGVPAHRLAIALSPWQAIHAAAQPNFSDWAWASDPVLLNLACTLGIAALLNGLSVLRIRSWNTVREIRHRAANREEPRTGGTVPHRAQSVSVHAAGGKVRAVWKNPVLWREVRTWAYGKKAILIRVAYWLVFGLTATMVVAMLDTTAVGEPSAAMPAAAQPVLVVMVVSLLLLNAQAVTSLTNERDSGALVLLLATELTPKEVVFGKLGGAFYNAKEMVVLPLALCGYLWAADWLSLENLLFLIGGWIVLTLFAAVLGLHAGITYANSRTAIATSLGTLMFLFLGVATCMRIMLAFSSSFESQFGAFIGLICGGSVGMYVALSSRYRTAAIGWMSGLTPFLTFYLITSFLVGNYGTVFIVAVGTYGFATAAMLVPAVSVFDVALESAPAAED